MIDDLEKGTWLVVVEDNTTSAVQVNPDFIEIDAALHYMKEAMVRSMAKKAELRPHSTKMSKKEIKAWETYNETMGKDMPTYFSYPSLYDIATAGCEAIREKVKKNKNKFAKEIKRNINPITDLELP